MAITVKLVAPRHLPRILVTGDGSNPWRSQVGVDAGPLLRDTSLDLLAAYADSLGRATVDIDSVEGLNSDDAGCEFLVRVLGIRSVITRRAATAMRLADLGARAFYHVHAVDSTAFESSMEKHPRAPEIGTVISPGLLVLHLREDQLDRLPRPLVAWGFIDAPEDALNCLRRCDAIAVDAEAATRLVGLGASIRGLAGDDISRERPAHPLAPHRTIPGASSG